jgi:hypothetical protein
MAGTLTISTLSDGTNSTSSTNCIQGSAKAWVNFNASSGSSAVIRASYNVSSVTYNATGKYTVNFTNAFSDTNYLVSGSCAQTLNSGTSGVIGTALAGSTTYNNKTTSACDVWASNFSVGFFNNFENDILFLR